MAVDHCKLITCILPNDGTDNELRRALKMDKNIIGATSLSAKGVAVLTEAKTRSGNLPESAIVRIVQIVVIAEQADEIFDYVYHKARIGRHGGGVIYQSEDLTASPFYLPEGLPNEE